MINLNQAHETAAQQKTYADHMADLCKQAADAAYEAERYHAEIEYRAKYGRCNAMAMSDADLQRHLRQRVAAYRGLMAQHIQLQQVALSAVADYVEEAAKVKNIHALAA